MFYSLENIRQVLWSIVGTNSYSKFVSPFSGHSWSGKRDWDGASKVLTFSGTASYMSPLKSLLRPTRLFFIHFQYIYIYTIHSHPTNKLGK